MKRLLAALLGAAAMTMGLLGQAAPVSAQDPCTIALIPGLTTDAFYITMRKGAEMAAKAVGCELLFQGAPEFNPTLQVPVLQAVIARQPDAILIAPTDKQQLIAPLQQAVEAGIPVITVDTFIDDGKYQNGTGPGDFPLSYIATDNVLGGFLAGLALARQIGEKGKVYVSNVNPGISTTDQREEGFKAAMANFPGITVLETQFNGNDANKAASQAQAVFARDGDLAGVFGANLFSALGAADGVKALGKSGAIRVVAFDAPTRIVDDLKSGLIDLAVAQHPAEIGYYGVMTAFAVINDQSVPPQIGTGATIMTKDNIDDPAVAKFVYSDESAQALAAQPVGASLERHPALAFLTVAWSWLFLLLLLVFFEVWARAAYGASFLLNGYNLQSIAVSAAMPLLLGLGQTFVIIAGGIDLSVGFVMGFASVVMARAMQTLTPVDAILALGAGLLAAMLAALVPGTINGTLISRLRVPAFIGTLGMYGVARGAGFLTANGTTVPVNNPLLFTLGNGKLLGVPIPVVITVALVLVMHWVLSQTRFGQHTYAIGGNRTAAVRAGINIRRHTLLLYMISAGCAGIAGMIYTARFSAGAAQAGEPLLLDSIAAVVIGGASLFGGSGTVIGTVIGALIIAVIQYGLVFINVEPFWQFVAVGVVIIVSVLIDQTRERLTGEVRDAD